ELYDLETHKPPTHIDRKGELYSLLFSHDGKTLFTGWGDGTILISEVGGTNVSSLEVHNTLPVFSLELSPDGNTLASGGADERILLRDLLTGVVKEPFAAASPCGESWSLTFSPDSRWLVAGGRTTVMTLWDLQYSPVPDV